MADLKARIPDYAIPIINPKTGQIDPVWFQFFLKLFDRTGGDNGGDSSKDHLLILATVGLVNSVVSQPGSMRSKVADLMALTQESAIQVMPKLQELGQVPAHGVQYDEMMHALVTTSTHGFMSAADKVKLNGVIAGAGVVSVSGVAPIASSGGSTPAISISAATTSAPGSMSATDKTKLDGLPQYVTPTSIISSVTTTNTTADAAINTIAIPANKFVAGSVLNMRMAGVLSGAAAGGNFNVWVKVGATKMLTLTISMPAGATSNIGMRFEMTMTQRSTSVMQFAGFLVSAQNTYLPIEIIAETTNGVSTTVANTFTAGWNWSTANAANIAVAHTCIFKQEI